MVIFGAQYVVQCIRILMSNDKKFNDYLHWKIFLNQILLLAHSYDLVDETKRPNPKKIIVFHIKSSTRSNNVSAITTIFFYIFFVLSMRNKFTNPILYA